MGCDTDFDMHMYYSLFNAYVLIILLNMYLFFPHQNQRSSMSGLSNLLGQRPMSAGSPLGMMGLMSMFSQMGVKSSQLPNRPSHSQSNPSNLSQGATGNRPSSSNSEEAADVFSLLHNICDKVSGMREDEKRKAKESDEARREENGTADEQPNLDNTQMNSNNVNSVEEIRYVAVN